MRGFFITVLYNLLAVESTVSKKFSLMSLDRPSSKSFYITLVQDRFDFGASHSEETTSGNMKRSHAIVIEGD